MRYKIILWIVFLILFLSSVNAGIQTTSVIYQSSTLDGFVVKKDSFGTDFQEIRDSATGSYANDTEDIVASGFYNVLFGDVSLKRGFFYFNTSSIPDSAIVLNTSLLLTVVSADSSDDTLNFSVQRGTQNLSGLTVNDYQSYTGPIYNRQETIKTAGTQINFTFNNSGVNDINKTGITRICLRNYDYDYLNVTPVLTDFYYIHVHSINSTTPSKSANLTVIYQLDLPPVITVNSPANTTLINNNVTFNITLDEAGDTCVYSLNGFTTNTTMDKSTSTNFNITNSSMPNGHYTASFWCNDTGGQVNNTATIGFTVDTTAGTSSTQTVDASQMNALKRIIFVGLAVITLAAIILGAAMLISRDMNITTMLAVVLSVIGVGTVVMIAYMVFEFIRLNSGL